MSKPAAAYVIRKRLRDGQYLYLIGGSALTGQASWFPAAPALALRFTVRAEAKGMRDAIASAEGVLEVVPAPAKEAPRG